LDAIQFTPRPEPAVRLSRFIITNSEKILAEFEAFARSIVPKGTMDIAELRDHAQQMLTVVARDLETPQTKREGTEKSRGRSDSNEISPDTPAQEHGFGRAQSGFTMAQMVSEYRALRSSVIRLWIEEKGELGDVDLVDLVRFNEAIDQALAESTARFAKEIDETRETFLGILGHDLRSPLGAIITSAKFMLGAEPPAPIVRTLVGGIVSSGERMNDMVATLLDFTRGRLGVAIPIERTALDLNTILRNSVDEIKAAHPEANVVLRTSGDLRGEWDGARLSQVLSNLLSNAIKHGSAGTPVTVTARGEGDHVVISVHNLGSPILPQHFQQIFKPMSRTASTTPDPNHLGLGLYIAERVITAHSGTIEVESAEGTGTTFTIRLPRSV
jgi:signal transduction histidine kinase